jgi:hypothetical protein
MLDDAKITKMSNPVSTISAIKQAKREYPVGDNVSYPFTPNAFAVKEYPPL